MLKNNDLVDIYNALKCPICGHAPNIEVVCDTDGGYGVVRCCGYEFKNLECAKAIESWNEHVTWRNNLLKPKWQRDFESKAEKIIEQKTVPYNPVQMAMYKNLVGRASYTQPEIKDVIFNDPATIILWMDGTKTVVKAQDGEAYDPEKGMAMAITKKVMGNKGNYYDIFKKYIKEEE